MTFTETPLAGAHLIDMTRTEDERGFFARTFCAAEFAAQGLAAPVSQCSVSFNARQFTLRGLHFQVAPHDEAKLVRCTRGAIFDVIVDLREGSRTHLSWFGAELTAANHRALYIPKGFAHGFLSLADATEVFYMISEPYAPGYARGLRWNDPALGIRWPRQPAVIAARDAEYPLLERPPAFDLPAAV
jgi:dTDP-4-dehydrorhamnose 3,5-epimerase